MRPEAMTGYLGDNAARVFGTPTLVSARDAPTAASLRRVGSRSRPTSPSGCGSRTRLFEQDARALRAAVARAESSGIDHLVVGDHVSFHRGRGYDGLLHAAALASLTETLTIETGVYLLGLRHPVPVARQVTSVAQLAPGRFVFGVGLGGEDRHELEVCGVDPTTRGRRLDESPHDRPRAPRRRHGRLRRPHLPARAGDDPSDADETRAHRDRRTIRRRVPAHRAIRRRLARPVPVARAISRGGGQGRAVGHRRRPRRRRLEPRAAPLVRSGPQFRSARRVDGVALPAALRTLRAVRALRLARRDRRLRRPVRRRRYAPPQSRARRRHARRGHRLHGCGRGAPPRHDELHASRSRRRRRTCPSPTGSRACAGWKRSGSTRW